LEVFVSSDFLRVAVANFLGITETLNATSVLVVVIAPLAFYIFFTATRVVETEVMGLRVEEVFLV
jgi:hypothetical protein